MSEQKMNLSDPPKALVPWWVHIVRWLWRAASFISATVVLGVIVNILSILLTTSQHTIPTNSPLGQLLVHWPITLAITLCFILLTILIWVLNRKAAPIVPLSFTQQNRASMLRRLRPLYDRMMDQSLQGAPMIELSLVVRLDIVQNPATSLSEDASFQSEQVLPSGTSIIEIYDRAGHELLILGEPGAGKSTLLLKLAKELLARAEKDSSSQLPIIFPLSSWALTRLSLDDWISEQLTLMYDMPRRLSVLSVQEELIVPLLDSLDEVPREYRLACVAAINTYRLHHNLTPMVVCSRQTEYLELTNRIFLDKAITIQPLSSQQIDAYLHHAPDQFEGIRVALLRDRELQELVTNPLLLNILTLAYHGKSTDSLLKESSPEILRQQLFAAYVDWMLQRRGTSDYRPQQVIRWLSWIAHQMVLHRQTEFYPRQMQQDWLPNSNSRLMYRLISGLIADIVILPLWLLSGLLTGLFFSRVIALPSAMSIALITGLVGGLLSWVPLSITYRRSIDEEHAGTMRVLRLNSLINELLSGPLIGILSGLTIGILNSQFTNLSGGLSVGALVGLAVGLLSSLFNRLLIRQIASLNKSLQHFTIRFLLWRAGSIPWNYSRLLEYASDRLLLRSAGRAYIFPHRLFLDYFASLNTPLSPVPLVDGTLAQIEMIEGSTMITGEAAEIVLRVTNNTLRPMGQIAIELLPSAEYTLLSPKAAISSLAPGRSSNLRFRLQMNVTKQVIINYLLNGELKIPPFYVNALRSNPYSYGNPVEAASFFGRKEELEQILQAVTKPNKQDIFLVGERRTGKTSLLYQIDNRLDTPFISVYINISVYRPQTETLLDQIVQKIIETLIERDILEKMWVTHSYSSTDFIGKVSEIIQSAQKKIPQINLILLLDEADFLLQVEDENNSTPASERTEGSEHRTDGRIQSILRAALQSPKTGSCLRAVVAGSVALSTFMVQHSSPFFNHFRFVHLKPLSTEETLDLIVRPARMLGYSYSSSAIERISFLSGGQPFYCQALCYEAFTYALQLKNTIIDDRAVDVAEGKIRNDFFSAYISGFWERATRRERAILVAVARGKDNITVSQVAVERLLDWQLILPVGKKYRFAAGLYQQWTIMTQEKV